MIKDNRILLKGFDKVTPEYEQGINDPEVTRYMESVRNYVLSPTNLQKWLDNTNKNPNMRYWGIYTMPQKIMVDDIKRELCDYCDNIQEWKSKFIGTTNLNINWIHSHADIGIMIFDKSEWNKGYATEAIGLVKEYAFNTLNLHRLYTGIYDLNIGSIKAFEKNGFVREGLLAEHRYCEGKYVNQIIMGCLNVPD